jgi:hypothetical protein
MRFPIYNGHIGDISEISGSVWRGFVLSILFSGMVHAARINVADFGAVPDKISNSRIEEQDNYA